MFSYNIIDNSYLKLNEKNIDKIFEKFSNLIDKKQNGTLNIVFVDAQSIKNLNKKYRKIDKITDVLSFHYFDDFSDIKNEDIAGEIILCIDKIKEQAKEYNWSKQEEFYKLLIHSILHILGYDHEEDNDYKIMSQFEKRIWNEVFEK